MSKNIEKIKGEEALSEIVDITLDDAKLNGLVSNDVADMYQSASGLKPLKPIDTYESPIVELKANLKLIFRQLFSVPLTILGSNKAESPISIIKMMEQMFNHYRERLKGSEKYGIPSRLSSLTDLPSAPALLADRKISGVPEAADGMSVIHLIEHTSDITEINDDNEGWTMTKNIFSLFTNLKKWISKVRFVSYKIPKLNTQAFISNKLEELDLSEIEDLTNTTTDSNGTAYSGWFNFANLKRANLRKLKSFTGCLFWGGKAPEELELPALETAGRGILQGVSGVKRVIADNLKTCPGYSYNPNLIADCPDLEYASFAGLQSCNMYGTSGAGGTLQNLPKMKHLRLGKCNIVTANSWNKDCFSGCGSLIKLEIIGNLNQSLYLNNWSPTLDESNLQQFLSNFKTYIAERLTDNGSGLTLTLSQAVYDAIKGTNGGYASTHTLGEICGESLVLTPLEIELGITENTLYSTWLTTYFGENGINWNIETPN